MRVEGGPFANLQPATMNALPVIVRELRVEARHPFTAWLRVAGGGTLLAMLFAQWLTLTFDPHSGDWLFAKLHVGIFFAIWILVPLLAADCISQERRENTLGLLCLTPLRPFDIIAAKGFAHGLRALTLWLAALPVLMVPLLFGGVPWGLIVSSVLLNFGSICWALAAGLLASSVSRVRNRALVLASLLAFVFLLLNGAMLGRTFSNTLLTGWLGNAPGPMYGVQTPLAVRAVGNVLYVTSLSGRAVTPPGTVVPLGIFPSFCVAGFGLAALLTGLLLAVPGVKRGAREGPPPPELVALERTFCTPRFGVSVLKRWLRRKLERNPIGWLEQRRWSVRLLSWSWLAVIASLLSLALQDIKEYRNWATFSNKPLAWALVLSLGVTAAGSFRRERETGVMELLLVSPLRMQEIIGGRLRGLWLQFLPAFALLLGAWLYLAEVFNEPEQAAPILFFGSTFLTLPVIGLYFSLQRRGFFGALFSTALCAIVIPRELIAVVDWFGRGLGGSAVSGEEASVLSGLLQLAFAVYFGWRLADRLRRRTFALERTGR